MTLIEGVVIGKVKNDPQKGKQVDGKGNIYVEFPWLTSSDADDKNKRGYWAPVATTMAGNDRGTWFMPEVDDEVLIAFDHGDVDHPYILGFLWNGKATPPEKEAEKRLIKSKKGHSILLDDTDGQEKIVLTTGLEKMTITMDDPGKSITIKATQSVTIEGPESVTVKSNGSVTVEGNGSVTVKSGASVTVEASTVQVNAGSISLGEGAFHPAVWGDELQIYLELLYAAILEHQHVGELALGIFPVTPMVGVPPPPPVPPILSAVVKEA